MKKTIGGMSTSVIVTFAIYLLDWYVDGISQLNFDRPILSVLGLAFVYYMVWRWYEN